MTRRSLALVANFHRERRIGRKTANFLGQAQARLHAQGVDFLIEFVLDRPDAPTIAQIEAAAAGIPGSRVHLVDFGNLGISRTFGVNCARADVVCFTDGDDFFSFNWFEGALEFFSVKRPRVVLHTQYMVGFDNEQFIRETTQSIDPWFDPLALAAEWYWSANLAIEAETFAAAPIQPYDHAGGFGSEDWHWTCNCLAEGIERVALPDTSYFYRVKPERFALGKVADVIHMASPLFEPDRLPARAPDFMAEPPPVSPLSTTFFEQAREIEQFELGVSYLRAVEVGAETIRHFRPHTPPIVGTAYREALANGFGGGSVIVFADSQRLPGGLDTAARLCSAVTGAPERGRLYIVDGDHGACQPRPDGYAISLGDLRAAKMYNDQIDRLIARFFIQNKDLTVFNMLSPRSPSRALAFSRATRGSVRRWINVVSEYGFDALSQAYDELDSFAAAGIASENIGIFEKTVAEAWRARGACLVHDVALEAAFVSGDFGSLRPETLSWRAPSTASRSPSPVNNGGGSEAAQSFILQRVAGEAGRKGVEEGAAVNDALVIRIGLPPSAEPDAGSGGAGWVTIDERLRERAREARQIILVGGDAFLGERITSGSASGAAIRIPALTIVRFDKPPAYYFRPQVAMMNEALAGGSIPADLSYVGAFGIAGQTFREVLDTSSDRVSVASLLHLAMAKARASGEDLVAVFDDAAVVSASGEDLERLGGPQLLLEIARGLSGGAAHG